MFLQAKFNLRLQRHVVRETEKDKQGVGNSAKKICRVKPSFAMSPYCFRDCWKNCRVEIAFFYKKNKEIKH